MQATGSSTPRRSQQAILYLRVSTEEQVENYSLTTQLDICTKEAERHGLEVIRTFQEEGRSAKTIKGRPALVELLEFCRKHKREIDAVIVYRLDRVSRQTADYLAIRKKLAELEITLISATEPTGDTPTEKFIETMLAGFAQMDNDVRGERSRNGMRARFLSGLHNGSVPMGYSRQSGYAAKDPETFDAIKADWELMTTGTKSLREMARILNDQGIRDRRKGYKDSPLRAQTLNGIFRNKFYAGVVVSKKYGLEVRGQHTPMITEEQFYRVQAILDGRNRNSPTLGRRSLDSTDFPLRRIVSCSICSQSLTGAWSRGKRQRYAYYFCPKRCNSGKSIPVKMVEAETTTLLDRISLKPKTIELLNSFLRKTYYKRIASVQQKRDRADVELQKVYELRQALIEKNLAGVYSDDIFKDQNRLLEDKIKAVQAVKNDAHIEKYNLEAITEFIAAKFKDLNCTYAESNLEQKRVLLCSIFPQGLHWSYPGYSNTEISPFYKAILDIEDKGVQNGAPEGIRTPDTQLRKLVLYPLSYRRAPRDCTLI